MAMSAGSAREGEPMMEINTTPLIDVMLVLIVMLIITIPIQTHAVKLNMPVGNPPPPTVPPTVFQIDVDFDGTIFWNGETVAGRADLETRLGGAAAMDPQPEIHLRPNKLAQYKDVAMVMATAQRLGLVKLGVVGNEQFVK
ncbi:MAG TPA: biopolymer transporter ExbD [Usitatibacteraceae bacterium]|nr:biopolymer transporter ExbD [Usitatibacteraceae bacterium]